MADFSVSGLQIAGIGCSIPKQEISNYDYDLLEESEKKLLVKTIGVETRRVASKGTTTTDLAIDAAEKLFVETKWDKESVDLIVVVTQSRDYYLPSVGPIVQDKLGLSTKCMAFDVGLGCSGYVYGLSIVASMLKGANWKRAILLAGDVSTISCSYNDKSTYPLFGDAGSATFIENTESGNNWIFNLNSDGSGEDAIKITHGCLRNLPNEESFIEKERAPGVTRADLHLALDGLEVFNFSITTIPKSIKQFLENYKLEQDNIDAFVMHQANLLMNETIRKKLKFTPDQTLYSIKKYGNTSSASIPLTICNNEGQIDKGDNMLLSGFGVGLSWGNAYIELDEKPITMISDFD